MMRKLNFAVLAFFLLLLAAGCTFSFNLEKDMGPILMIYDEETSLVTIQNEIADNSEYSSIHYTLDGSTPTEKSPEYTAPIPVEKGTLVKAVVFTYFPEFAKSPCFEMTVKSAPSPLPEYSIFDAGNDVYIYTFIPKENTEVYYTLDGADPSEESDSRIRYTEPFSASYNRKVRFCALWEGHISKVYEVPGAPFIIFSHAEASTIVTVSVPEGAEAFYTLDGTDPFTEGILYEGPVSVTEDTLFKACLKVDGFYSPVASAGITTVPPAPQISIESAKDRSTVTLSVPFGSSVYYTEGYYSPSAGTGTLYKGPFTVDNGSRIQAVAVRGGVESIVVMKDVLPSVPDVSIEYINSDICRITFSHDKNAYVDGYINENSFYRTDSIRANVGDTVKCTAHIGIMDSEEFSFEIPAATQPEKPVISYEKDNGEALVTISSTKWARIWYTTDGSVPEEGISDLYEGPFKASIGKKIRAVAVIGEEVSEEMEITIPVDVPRVYVQPNGASSVITVEAEPGAEVHYRLSSSPSPELTLEDPVYSDPVRVPSTGYITVASYLGGKWSLTSAHQLRYVEPPAEPTIAYTSSKRICTVTLSDETPDAMIYYTTDGSNPMSEAYRTEYTVPFEVEHGSIVRAVAFRNGVFSENTVQQQVLAKSYNVTVETYDGIEKSFSVIEGDELDLSQFVREGYILTGVKDIFDGSTYTPDQKITVMGNMSLICEWKLESHTITVITEGFDDITLKVDHGNSFTVSDITRTGYVISSITDGNGFKYYPDSIISVYADMTFTAEWSLAEYDIDIYYGSYYEKTVIGNYGSEFNISSITRDGYEIDYVTYGDITYGAEDVLTVTGPMAIHYYWKAASHTVTIVSIGYNDITLPVENNGTFTVADITRPGYGIASIKDEYGNLYYPKEIVTVDRDMTFTAEWTTEKRSVYIYFNGYFEKSEQVLYGTRFKINSVERPGYMLDYVKYDYSNYGAGDELIVTSEMYVYYYWTSNSQMSAMFSNHMDRMIEFMKARNNPELMSETERIQYVMDIYLLSFPIPVSSLSSSSTYELNSYAGDAEAAITAIMGYIPTGSSSMAVIDVSYIGGYDHTYRFDFTWSGTTYTYLLNADDYAWYINSKPSFPYNFDISDNYGDSSLTYSNYQTDLGFSGNGSSHSAKVPCNGYWNTSSSSSRDYSKMNSTQLRNFTETLRAKETDYSVTKIDKYFPIKAEIKGNEFLQFSRFEWSSQYIVCQLFIQYADGSFKNWILTPGIPNSILYR